MSKRYWTFKLVCLLALGAQAQTPDIYRAWRTDWLAKAEANRPALRENFMKPVGTVDIISDATAFQGWRAKTTAGVEKLYAASFNEQKTTVLDFGEHLTGYFSLQLLPLRGTPDGPVKLRLTFGEVPGELATPFDPYTGKVSRAWLQDETVSVMTVPGTVRIERRLAFRYVKVELLGASPGYTFRLAGAQCRAVSSAGSMPQAVNALDKIGLQTLRECMQTVYEDGPKRDRRLWIGDLYLESLANSYSFKNDSLTRRCLYLLAGLAHPDGRLYATVFETPEPHGQDGLFILDYALLYPATLNQYLQSTGDTATAASLWPAAKQQLQLIKPYLKPNGLLNATEAAKSWWLFFDWQDSLDKEAALQGLSIYALKQAYELAVRLHREAEISEFPGLIKQLSAAARRQLYDPRTGLFYSGPEKQVSYAAQIWMVLAGVTSPAESRRALTGVLSAPKAVKPVSPYLNHYLLQALVDAKLDVQARQLLNNYWGGMAQRGADTYWEVYDPANERLSPYAFFPVNSYCHAWSCTPVYFIRKYPQIFSQ